jgi:hypothetical protein
MENEHDHQHSNKFINQQLTEQQQTITTISRQTVTKK